MSSDDLETVVGMALFCLGLGVAFGLGTAVAVWFARGKR